MFVSGYCRFAYTGFSGFGLASLLVACNLVAPFTPCGCSTGPKYAVRVVNFDGVESDSTGFDLDSLNVTANVPNGIWWVVTDSSLSPAEYLLRVAYADTISLELFRDSATKAKVDFFFGTGAGAIAGSRSYSLVWTDVVDSLGYTQVQIVEKSPQD